ncbi:hypothetical protein ACHAXA_008742 [Cyclostephanos tholiformis]|uniref:Uncharacterized protein n=1 Tax=Cyclostephanos tholiformis TaxID=382380 RepID=A0ABD3RB54_9STRA
MFVLALLADTIRVPPHLLSSPTLGAVSSIIERRYPNRIVIDVGLVICPYGPPLEVGDGILVPGDGGSHHQVLFRCLVFRPFVEEVLVGIVTGSHGGGVTVSVGGFFDHVFIPAYWMLNPSTYDEVSGLWVWTPTYDDEGVEDDGGDGETAEVGEGGGSDGIMIKREDPNEMDKMADEARADVIEGGGGVGTEEEGATTNRFEIEIGSEIRFKVKAGFRPPPPPPPRHRSRRLIGPTASTGAADLNRRPRRDGNDGNDDGNGAVDGNGAGDSGAAVRRRSSSVDLSDAANHPAPMQIVGSICEDGLGLIGWWKSSADEEGDDGRAEDPPIGDGMKMEEVETWMKMEEED